MKILFIIWLVVTVLMNIYICWRWSEKGLLNLSIKFSFFFVAIVGIVFSYYHFVANHPL